MRLALILVVLAQLTTACQNWRSLLGLPVEVPVTNIAVTQSRVGPPPTPACTPLTAGMALTATVQATGVVVEMAGLQPGELPEFQYAPAGQPREGFTVTPGQPVGADGRVVDRTWVRTHAAGSTSELWDIRVIHARGVACTQVVLPPA